MKTKRYLLPLGLVFPKILLFSSCQCKVLEELKVTFHTEKKVILKTYCEYVWRKQKDLSPWLISNKEDLHFTMTGPNKVILLVDEPTYGQDMKNAILIMNALEQLCKEWNVFVSLHVRSTTCLSICP